MDVHGRRVQIRYSTTEIGETVQLAVRVTDHEGMRSATAQLAPYQDRGSITAEAAWQAKPQYYKSPRAF